MESDGFVCNGGHGNGHRRGIYASLSVCFCVCLSVSVPLSQSASKPQDGSNLEKLGQPQIKQSCGEQRQEGRGGKEEENRGESRGHPFEFGRWWGNVGHAYLRKHCWREGSVIAGSE